MARKVKIGAVVEITTKLGKAYAQFSQYHEKPPRYGALLRVLPGIFRERPRDFKELVKLKETFAVFFPLQAAVNKGIVEVVAQEQVPFHAQKFPLFRAGNVNPVTGKVEQWWLWDGEESWKIERLTDEQLDLPIKEICNDLALIRRIEVGWTSRNAEAFMQAARIANKVRNDSAVSGVRHFLLFKNESQAERARQVATEAGFKCEVVDGGSVFSVVVEQGAPLTEEYVEHVTVQLAEIARMTDGAYDAWETS